MISFVHEDGLGNMMDDGGKDVVMMESDSHMFPVEMITDYDQYLDMKPPERMVATKAEFDKGMSVRAVALQLQIKLRTAQYWVQKDQKESTYQIVRNVGGDRSPGRPPKLVEEHQKFLVDLIDEKPSLVLDEMMANLTDQFANLDIKKSALHDFMTKKCKISLKRAHFQLVERNSPEKNEDRHAWVTKWLQTDMDYLSSCVFVDEAAFHINMKRSYAWSKKGSRAIVKVPKTRAITTTMLGAISPFGVVSVLVRRPKAMTPSKKRKATGSRAVDKTTGKRGTVTGHYFNFLSSTMYVLDRHEMFEDNYIVMDNAPIHQHEDIRKYIENRGYRCVYLPPYSPELNPIEQFWSVCKGKLKKEQLLEEETLTTRIQMACNQILIGDLLGFCKYSTEKFDECLNKTPI
ncbi:hypothetical protein G6F46_004097 [Rhizopus delemar]|uniref:Tc1-like transposase DDE domain-containing protein n=2 Tax=Rhizopus TaxID=4842 RepID=A0A9P7CIT9_9FUNG|nr:hypothetical protein G6F55_004638 [Rhizopus delemar]KAG1547382.1 hypothetical protein G6F51_004304 [Rhizopus arrhizus]KAG1495058.1 hypothetical protein G6F53_012447 [Rhizopus delemar]KAG1500624.1 hypothetical protein G6F54_003595 [Rhizopus delemar]KAG1523474.1 hypothetical protein G6F52_004991 [Rhizopus delemar]